MKDSERMAGLFLQIWRKLREMQRGRKGSFGEADFSDEIAFNTIGLLFCIQEAILEKDDSFIIKGKKAWELSYILVSNKELEVAYVSSVCSSKHYIKKDEVELSDSIKNIIFNVLESHFEN